MYKNFIKQYQMFYFFKLYFYIDQVAKQQKK